MQPPETTATFQPGDKVTYTGAGRSALDGGPGTVQRTDHASTWVRIDHACTVLGNQIKSGEILLFSTKKLKKVE